MVQLSQQELAGAIPIEWQDQTIAYLATDVLPSQVVLTAPAQTFLSQTSRLLLQAGLIAGGLAVVMGLFIARGLSAPLGRLATAARRFSRGELDQRVPVKGADEIAGVAQAFNEMATNLQQAETLRRNLVADVAHELRTPLSVIQGNLRAILDDVYPLEKSEIAAIFDETLILNRLINDLRNLVQAEAGQLSLNIQPAELAPIIEGVANLFVELTREKEVNLEVSLPDRLPPVLIDPDRVQQVLYNLLTNALRHTPEGGTIGIPAEDLLHVFDHFWRAGKSRSREHDGSGLGLAIARQLVEAQGGQIGVENDDVSGQGSRFWFTLLVA